MTGLAKAWDYALEQVPVHHFDALFKRAVQAKRDSYPLSAIDMLREWDDFKNELLTQSQQYSAQQQDLLEAGHGSLGRMYLDEWKARHNLPKEWRMGLNDLKQDPIPPESDLYNNPPTPKKLGQYSTCKRCDGARWLREPADMHRDIMPKLVRCPDCGNG